MDPILPPCPKVKVKLREPGRVITIGQLARYGGVSVKTIRVYHAKGLLAEPPRDRSGYRRYTARHIVDLIKIRTLAESGVPLARIRELQAAPAAELQRALRQIDADLDARIRRLRAARIRLRELAEGRLQLLPVEVSDHLDALPALGFTPRWIAMETDLWLLIFATHPETARELFHDQTAALGDPSLREIYLAYDRAHDLDPRDPVIDDLARSIVTATRARYGAGDLPGQIPDSEIPGLVQSAVNASSPAWQRLDHLIRRQLGA